MGIAKSLVYYLVYRPSKSANVTRIMADINRPVFRDASHLPPATLAFAGVCVSRFCVTGSYSSKCAPLCQCYSALLSYLIDMVKTGGVDIDLSQFPCVSEVYDELLGTATVLFAQEDDPELPVLRVYLAEFCNLRCVDMIFILLLLINGMQHAGKLMWSRSPATNKSS